MAQEGIPLAQEGHRCGTGGHPHGTGGHPHGTGRLWKAIAVAKEAYPWHRKVVEGHRRGKGGHTHGTVEMPAMNGNHKRTHTDMPWQGFDLALQITRPPEGDRR